MSFDAGEQDYSEYTPGLAWSSKCLEGRWRMSGYDISVDEYRQNLLKAEGCPDFRMATLPGQGEG
jgi:hypothetical protein